MIRAIISFYRPLFIKTIVYMAQAAEYEPKDYVKWFWRTTNFSNVMYRRDLDRTGVASLLLLYVSIGSLLQIGTGLGLFVYGLLENLWILVLGGVVLLATYPTVWAHLLIVPLWAGNKYIITPRQRNVMTNAEKVFSRHPGQKIAIVGSYGKTSMKELLVQVLGEDMKVAATPGNKNVLVSHAAFARTLRGDEDILIIEYGEGAPGDIAKFAELTHPTHAVITGVAPAHLDRYKTVEAAGVDIFSVANFVPSEHVYVNHESGLTSGYMDSDFQPYDREGALGWVVDTVAIAISGIDFKLRRGDQVVDLHSKLLGRHNIGPLALVTALALERGMSPDVVITAVAKTVPYEHRMQPYALGGAWVIDDTYNGNLEGIRAGVALLGELSAKRKIYVTPGLVDQGDTTDTIHHEVGALIAAANPDIVVLMQNSVTAYIQEGLMASSFKGEVRVEANPLDFYTNLKHFVAMGDVVLMQNDWTDNYQ